ncbi:MAG: hypothetical protein HOJ15_00130 [Candidatus Jacksonbacteria bacterium]|nr:hypothetical protein [Candidatus Jacksonbacteria bacterium]MBT6034195.1 hypothetical protein [Candidatus Jacksonbacteria bacterium]MBT6300823.1 hypothetical protein [Candidatus Jacksonbacteria bacterium]MBT6757094.1 hypothetical protein [Candidatus Jacksonbacteria bacterium]MBT6955649.1 hypothetical protein [Candidatus Jacksonbacteria bacterium]
MKKNILQQLERLDLSKNEAQIYLSLFKIGQTTAGDIIKKTSIHRAVVYDTLQNLIEKKLVFKLKKQKTSYFQATDPSKLLQDIQAKEEIAKSIVPELRDMIDESLPEITIHQGVEAYKQFWMDAIKRLPKGSITPISGSIGDQWKEFMGDSYEEYQKIRKQRRITWKMIVFYRESIEIELLKEQSKLNKFRIIKRDAPKHGNFNIFGDESIVLHSATEPMIIEIKNKTLVKVFQNIFDILWEQGKDLK